MRHIVVRERGICLLCRNLMKSDTNAFGLWPPEHFLVTPSDLTSRIESATESGPVLRVLHWMLCLGERCGGAVQPISVTVDT